MTLATVPRYDPERVSAVGGHAVVVGGSVAGLLTARVLADGFDQVTIVERDDLPDEATPRRGVPQGQHIHVFETAGRSTFEDLLPGYGEDLLSAGALVLDLMSDFHHFEKGGFLADGPSRVTMYTATRPLFEHVLRRKVAEVDGVAIRSGCQFVEYLLDDAAAAVDGVTIRDEESERTELAADLVVDASGRTSKTPAWLEDNGFEAPAVEDVRIDMAYSTALIERPDDDRRTFFVPPDPPRTRGGGMLPVEGGRWQATMFGVHGDHPPTTADALIEYAGSLPVSVLEDLLDAQPWVSDEITHYPFPSNRRRRYEALDQFPEGLVVIGDALTSFNPIYGQGMSVAALEALQLHHVLAAGDRGNLGLRFFDRVEEIIDVPWSIAVGGDFEFPQSTGPKPRGTDLTNRYLARLIRTAHTDGELRESLIRVFFLEQPPSTLFRPGIVWRVVRQALPTFDSTPESGSTDRSQNTP